VLRHTTGLPNWGNEKEAKLMFSPDSCFSYSGEGFVFLQKTIEKITSKPLNKIAQEEIFSPLKMENSSYEWTNKFDSTSAFGNSANEIKRHSSQNAAYSLLTNAHDYNAFLQAVTSGKGLKLATHRMMIGEATPTNWYNHKVTEATSHINWGLGVGLQQNENGKAIWHWGDNGGFKAFYIVFPATH
jgi:CubicO group peptidase (beta-lactamase class C family)